MSPGSVASLPAQSSLLPAEASSPDVLALAAARRGSEGHFSELHGQLIEPGVPPQGLSPLWQRFVEANGTAAWQDLGQRAARVQRRVQEDGATYNVYDEGAKTARAWPLELLPMLMDTQEWADIERGVSQRARLLNAAMADVYGERHLLEEGLLPPSLVLGHPQYLRPLHGCVPPAGLSRIKPCSKV